MGFYETLAAIAKRQLLDEKKAEAAKPAQGATKRDKPKRDDRPRNPAA